MTDTELLNALRWHAEQSNVEPRPRVVASGTTTFLAGEFDLRDVAERMSAGRWARGTE